MAVYSGNKEVGRFWPKSDGTFKFSLYGDFAYSIEARDFTDEIEGRSQRVAIRPGNSEGIKLIIQRINH